MCPRSKRWLTALSITLALLSVGCPKDDTYTVKERNYEGLRKVELEPSQPNSTSSQRSPDQADSGGKQRPTTGPEWVIVENVSNVAKAVLEEGKQAEKDGKQLVVYVGAVWCKPCKEFDAATKQANFGSDLDHIRLMKFDWYRHQTPLHRANYGSQYLPLFVVPGPDGKGSDKRFFGSRFKGQVGVEDLKKRLVDLASKR